ncbi:hypothetical protein SCHPADRAFT_810817, partial [Schizopora paradoxa]
PQFSGRSNWYEPGNVRCSREDCSFTGSKKSVEIHMMDRHLIYPPDWDKRKRKDDWDADASLKGKRISVQGTNVFLDTPEAIDAWIAERKKRWPSAARVAEKEKNLQDAIERGQIIPEDANLRSNKRRRMDDGPSHRDRGRGRGRGGTQRGGFHQGREANATAKAPVHPLPPKPVVPERSAQASSEDSSSDSNSDVDMEKDAVSTKIAPPGYDTGSESEAEEEDQSNAAPLIPVKRKHANQPRPTPYNAFGHHTSLLRNLLMPEIRVTVSNFSQALRFLVENDFLENVELKPGDAASNPIEVV